MAKLFDLQSERAARGRFEPVVAEVADALFVLGGAAHRQTVADFIVARREGRQMRASVAEADAIFAAFDRYVDAAKRRRPEPLLYRPLGNQSYRWALTAAGEMLCGGRTGRRREG